MAMGEEFNNEEHTYMEEGDAEGAHRPRRIALFVEPSPFAYISGYKNRFQNFIKHLREMGDEVIVVTTHQGVPREFHGAKLIGSWSFPCPWYRKVPLSLALSPRIISEVAKFKPDIIHASSPGIMVFGALVIAKLLSVPLVLSYHTHVPVAQLEKMFRGMPAVFTGMLHGEELSQAYASGDVFVMPSKSETLGQVVLESMSSAVPVMAARAGGITDIIPEALEGRTGFLFTPGDLEDCAGKIQRLLSSGELREAMGNAAREEMEKYDWRDASKKIRNENYPAAIWYWRVKRAQLLKPIRWLVRMFLPATPEKPYYTC